MQILFIAPLPPPVTGQTLINNKTLSWLKDTHDVDVIDTSYNLFTKFLIYRKFFYFLKNFYKIIFIKNKYDCIYFNISESIFGNLKDLLFFLLLGSQIKKTFVHLHGGNGYLFLLSKFSFFKISNGFFLKKMAGVIVLDKIYKNFLIGKYSLKNIYVLPNYADGDLFLNSKEIKYKFSRKRKLKIIFLSNFIKEKGYTEIVRAFKTLSIRNQNKISIDFAGYFFSDKERVNFLKSIERFKSLNYIGHISRVEEKRNLLSQAHVLCLPTYYLYEGQPVTILEAYSTGCAVITTDHASISGIFKDGTNGFIVKKNNIHDLAFSFKKCLNNRDNLIKMALINNKVALQKFHFNHYSQKFSKLFNFN